MAPQEPPPPDDSDDEMANTSRDVTLAAPSLLQLSASYISHNDNQYHFLDNVHLPMYASHAVLDQHRRQFKKRKNSGDTTTADKCQPSVKPWADAGRLPLEYLNLAGAQLDDKTLSDILAAHHNALTSIDLTDIKGISDSCNTLLETRKIRFPKLRALRMTGMELLSRPNIRRKPGDRRGYRFPVLGEEDLLTQGGSGRLDQMREVRGAPLGHVASMHLGVAQMQNQSNYNPGFEHSSAIMFNNSNALSSLPEAEIDWPEEIPDEEEVPEPEIFTSRCSEITTLLLPRGRKFPEDEEESPNEFLSRVLRPLKHLKALDLSYWSRLDDLRCLHPLNLTSLTLYDVPDLYRAIDSLALLTELKHLDLSQSSRDTGLYPRPCSTLHNLVVKLPKLRSLDISSTNLAAQPSLNDFPPKPDGAPQDGYVRSDIIGLRFLKNPLDYLGLFNCDTASHFGEIPAKHISGDCNEDQIVTSLRMYKDRAGLLQSVLNESYQLYRFGNATPLKRHTEALHLVLEAMQKHLDDSTLQIAGSASLFYIIRKVEMNRDTKKQVVSALLNGMEIHMEEQVMVRNCCLSLCQFEIPQEILFDYSRLAILLVKVLELHNADNLTQRIVVFLLNSMACHVEGDQKVQVGSFGAIEMILDQITRKLATTTCDDVMEVGWSFLWNITDETPVNCERFLKHGGLATFHKCFNAFSTERELVRNMMGLIGNIAEVDRLRYQLMEDDYIKVFVSLLDLVDDNIEISYNSAGVLAHMASDGDKAWINLKQVKRQEVMQSVVKATSSWKLDTRRFINYRSFRPILRLLPLWEAYASQHWAVWALANLTTTDGAKYCIYVTDEGGVPLLRDLVSDGRTLEETRTLAQKVLDNIEQHSTWEIMDSDVVLPSE